MEHSLPLISTLAIAFGLALVFGYLAERVKMPALVGYLLAGIMAGKNTWGPVADMEVASELMEVGVMLLMFGVGLHFSIGDLLRVKKIAVPGAVLQMLSATVLGSWMAHEFWAFSIPSAIVFGLCLSCASTVVLLKALELQGTLNTIDGQISVGWLVVEDIVCVLILVLLPPFAHIFSGEVAFSWASISWSLLVTAFQVTAFVAVMLLVGQRFIPWALMQIAKTGSRELFTLSLLAAAIGIAYGASIVFHVSFALGAFFAGMVMRESRYAHRAVVNSLPLQDAFSVLFFVGVGMMLDWHILVDEPMGVLTVLAIILFGKSISVFVLVHFMGYPLHTTLSVGAALAQIGEFTFILASQAITLKLMDPSVMSLLVAASIFSIALNPIVFASTKPFRRFLTQHFAWARRAAMAVDPLSVLPQQTPRKLLAGQVILVGEGVVSTMLMEKLIEKDIPFVSVVSTPETAEELRSQNRAVIQGDPSDPMVLVQAHIASALMLVLAASDGLNLKKIVDMAKQLNPDLEVLVRARDNEQAAALKQEGIENVFNDREAVAQSLVGAIYEHYEGEDEDDEPTDGH